VTLTQSSGTLNVSFSGFKDETGKCFLGVPANGTFSASVGTDSSGTPILTNVSIVMTVTLGSNPTCQDLEIKIPGPVAVVKVGSFLVAHADDVVQIQSQCGNYKYTGFDMSRSTAPP